MSKVSVKFERTKNYDYAKGNPNRDDNTIYFPTNADCIVMGGKAYGLKDSSSVQQALDAAAETAEYFNQLYGIIGSLEGDTGAIAAVASDLADFESKLVKDDWQTTPSREFFPSEALVKNKIDIVTASVAAITPSFLTEQEVEALWNSYAYVPVGNL